MPNLPLPEGVTIPDLECVMLDVEPFDVKGAFGENFDELDLFFGTHPNLKYAQGDVAADVAHVTILFGIHPSENYQEDVMTALDWWRPEDVLINEIGYFPSRVEGEDYNCIVAHVVKSVNLVTARRALEELPYTDPFPTYSPHITLAYIKGSANLEEWIFRMNAAFAHKIVKQTGLNLGLDE